MRCTCVLIKKSEKQDNITVKLSAVRNQSNIKIKIKYLLSQLSRHPFSAYTPQSDDPSSTSSRGKQPWIPTMQQLTCYQLCHSFFSDSSLWPIHCVHPFQASLFFSTHTDTSHSRVKTFDQRSFSYCAPQQWNSFFCHNTTFNAPMFSILRSHITF